MYPERLPRPQWLIYYEQQLGFNGLEINYTYYRMPSHRTMEGLVKKTSDAFRFAIKVHRSMTHDILQKDYSVVDNPQAFEEFREGVKPLVTSGKLGCVLAQFPYAFFNKSETRDYLATTIDRLADLNLIVEFRNKSWATPKTFQELRERKIGLCTVDEPALPRLMPWVVESTSEIGYVRFHGRNAEKWFGTSSAERYDYLYNETELQEFMNRIMRFPEQVQILHLYFNNCHAGSAAKNARRFKELLSGKSVLPAT